jgi:hypothetical protein
MKLEVVLFHTKDAMKVAAQLGEPPDAAACQLMLSGPLTQLAKMRGVLTAQKAWWQGLGEAHWLG